METTMGQEKQGIDNLGMVYDNKGTLLGTLIPNCFFRDLLRIKYREIELKILLFICRMSFGFNRELTNSLELKDFTGHAKPHLSEAIKKLLKRKAILRNSKNGDKYLYAINLLPYGVKMKYYKIANPMDKLGNKEYEIGKANYAFGNPEKDEDAIIVYNPKGYSKQLKVYIKNDINTNINTDIKKNSATFASKVTEVHSNNSNLGGSEKLFLGAFKNEFNKNPTADTVLQYLTLMNQTLPEKDVKYFEDMYTKLYVDTQKTNEKVDVYWGIFYLARLVFNSSEYKNAPDKNAIKVEDVVKKNGERWGVA